MVIIPIYKCIKIHRHGTPQKFDFAVFKFWKNKRIARSSILGQRLKHTFSFSTEEKSISQVVTLIYSFTCNVWKQCNQHFNINLLNSMSNLKVILLVM